MNATSETVLIPVEGKVARVPLKFTGTDWDRLALAWCLLAVPAMHAWKKSVAMPDRYIAKTLAQLPKDPEELRTKLNAWAAQSRYKAAGKIDLHSMLRLLFGNQCQAGLLWVSLPDGAVDREVQQTAKLLLGHPAEDPSAVCAACKAIRSYDWLLAIRIAAHRDAPIVIGALLELYRGALQAGLVPMAHPTQGGALPAAEEEAPKEDGVAFRFDDGQVLRDEDRF